MFFPKISYFQYYKYLRIEFRQFLKFGIKIIDKYWGTHLFTLKGQSHITGIKKEAIVLKILNNYLLELTHFTEKNNMILKKIL